MILFFFHDLYRVADLSEVLYSSRCLPNLSQDVQAA